MKKLSRVSLSLFAAFVAVASCVAFAASNEGGGSGKVVGDKTNRFEVNIDKEANRVEVRTLKADSAGPRRMSITLFSDKETKQTIELQAVNPTERFPRFEGQLGPNAGSVAGFTLKFGFNMKALKALPYVPYNVSKAR